MKEEGKERRKGSERKRKEAKGRCDMGKKLDEDGKHVVLNVTA